MRKMAIAAIVCGGAWLLAAPSATGQSLGYNAVTPQSSPPFYSAASARPPVSPYLNLGDNANGITTYQTLVRPLIAEREAIERQSDALDRLNRQLQGAAATGDWREVEKISRRARPQRGVRFMDYSHYFGTPR
jgi:hypothetical protein